MACEGYGNECWILGPYDGIMAKIFNLEHMFYFNSCYALIELQNEWSHDLIRQSLFFDIMEILVGDPFFEKVENFKMK